LYKLNSFSGSNAEKCAYCKTNIILKHTQENEKGREKEEEEEEKEEEK
jgi:hypothetical protein